MSKNTETIDDDFYSSTDINYMTELIADWLYENDIEPISFNWKISVEYFE